MDYAQLSASERRTLPPAVAVSTVAFALQPPADANLGTPGTSRSGVTLWIPLVRRTRSPFAGVWALPGGPIPWDEALGDTARRTLHEVVGRAPGYLEQLYSFGSVERSAQAQRLVTIAYWALYGEGQLTGPRTPPSRAAGTPRPGSTRRWDDAPAPGLAALGSPTGRSVEIERDATRPDANVAWFSADALPQLAFDHGDIVATALERLRSKTEYASLAHRFLGTTFTLAQLRAVTEAILGTAVDPANFRRQVLAQGTLAETGETTTGTAHRPARLYRFVDEPAAARSDGTPNAPNRRKSA